MVRKRFSVIWLILFLLQASCSIPIRQVDKSKTRIEAIFQLPDGIMKHGETYLFVMHTEKSTDCYLGFRYMDNTNQWISVYLPVVESGEAGLCEWAWKIPMDAKDGLAEVRAYVEKNGQTNYLAPDDFCIEVCK
jgi:hypothetical protein